MRVSVRQLAQRLFFLICMCTVALGQTLPFHTYTTKDGLISNRILTITQDSRGYLWIGTAEGVSVFDGVTFKNYGIDAGLAGSYVTSIAESRKVPGVMWIGTLDGGLSKFDHGTLKKIDLDTAATQVYSLIEDRDGVLWCGTNRFLLQIREGRIVRFRPDEIPAGGHHQVGRKGYCEISNPSL